MFIFAKIVPIAHVSQKIWLIFVADELDLHKTLLI